MWDAHPLPLASQAVALAPHPRAALVGDAAAMVNPFTGEGIHYGIWAGHALGRAIGSSANANASWQAALASYAQALCGRVRGAHEGVRRIARHDSLAGLPEFTKLIGVFIEHRLCAHASVPTCPSTCSTAEGQPRPAQKTIRVNLALQPDETGVGRHAEMRLPVGIAIAGGAGQVRNTAKVTNPAIGNIEACLGIERITTITEAGQNGERKEPITLRAARTPGHR